MYKNKISKIINSSILKTFSIILTIVIIVLLIINTWHLFTEPLNIGNAVANNTLDVHITELLNSSPYKELKLINIPNLDEVIYVIGTQETLAYIFIEMISIEFQLILSLVILIYILKLISNKNIDKPLKSTNIKRCKSIIVYLIFLILTPILMYLSKIVILPSFGKLIGKIFPYIYEIISINYIIYLILFILIKTILTNGKDEMNSK